MEDDVGIRKFVELIFVEKFQVTTEMTAQDSSYPQCLVTNDFPRKLQYVLMVKQAVVCDVYRKCWSHFIEVYRSHWISSEAYLKSVLTACLADHSGVTKVFDIFLGVCGLVRFFGIQISQVTGKNFYDFNTDIVFEYYKFLLKGSFIRSGGFHRLVGYIYQHRYLKWKLDLNDLAALDDPSAHVPPYVAEKLEKELTIEREARKKIRHWKDETRQHYEDESESFREIIVKESKSLSEKIALIILSTTSVKLLSLPCSHDPNQTDSGMNLNEKAKTSELTEPVLKPELLDDDAMNLNEKVKSIEINMETEAALKLEPINDYSMNLKEKANTEGTKEMEPALKSEPLDDDAINLNEKAKSTKVTIEMEVALKPEALDNSSMNLNEKAKSTEVAMEIEAALKSEYLDDGTMNLNEKAKNAEGSMLRKPCLKSKPLDDDAMNLSEKVKSTERIMEMEVALKSKPLDEAAMNLNEKAKPSEVTMEMEAVVKSETFDELPSHLSSNSNLKVNQSAVTPQYESIVQTVIKHNRSKSSDLTNCDKQPLEEANRIFNRLKDRIKYLIEALVE